MNILYIAFSCEPSMGSEDKIGWSIPLESAKKNKIYVITKEEHRNAIEKYLCTNESNNIQFYYVDIPQMIKKVFRGFLFSGRLNEWHRRALPLAREICLRENIQIIHQITPVEFRSIGKYWRIPGVKFVCGPIAGGQKPPKELMEYAGRYRGIEWLRNFINEIFRLSYLLTGKVKKCEYIWFGNKETYEFLRCCKLDLQKCELLPDVSVAIEDCVSTDEMLIQEKKHCTFVVAGRLVHLKGHDLLFDAFERIGKEHEFECKIVGDGVRMKHLQDRCVQGNLESRVIFTGAVPHSKMAEIYRSADVLIMPSFREATGSVLLEAMANGLPVVTINKFGGAIILNENTGWLYEGNSKEEYIENLKSILIECIQNPEEVKRKGKNARKHVGEFTWGKKMHKFQKIYDDLVAGECEASQQTECK